MSEPTAAEAVRAVGYENDDGTLYGYANHINFAGNPGAIPVRIIREGDYAALALKVARMSAKLLELAGDCGECMGSGTVMSKRGAIENVPCTDCEDIRSLLP